MDQRSAERMMVLFQGLEGIHGTHGVPDREGMKWGIKKTARTLRESATVDHWLQHLRGERPLGIVPIRADHTCYWGSIDVDQYDSDQLDLVKKVEKADYPLVPCISKSGGLHLFIFMSEPQPADAVQSTLRDIAAALGLAGSEIFPKQTSLLTERGDAGSWMVMPYYGDTFEGRLREQRGVKSTGNEMSIDEFLILAERARLTTKQFESIVAKRAPSREPLPFSDGPRCLQHLARGGFSEGGRNSALFHMAVYFKRKHPGDWQERLEEANRKHMKPPLTADEVLGAVRSLEKKDYQYTCDVEPMKSHCDVAVCRGRRFGVGEAGSYPVISGLSKLDIPGDPIWFVDIEQARVEITTEELQNYYSFQRACLGRLNRMFRVIKQSDWVVIVAEALVSLTVIEPPPDVGHPEAFRERLEEFLTNRTRGDRKEDLLASRPWFSEEEGRHYFRLKDLETFLEREGMRGVKRSEISQRLKMLGGEPHFFNIKVGTRQKGVNVWWVPASAVVENPELDVPETRSSVI